ncbi:MAG TPA: ABC transporter ATP-binding protein [Bryobacteraceae bacterium]|nr:ABC transporter ATP-binding protein [Bryobacteraceae bacterium]
MILVQNVSKLYKLYNRPSDRLLELLPFRKTRLHSDFWALKHISFSVEPGEILGLVGPNGSGKSTLLQVVAGIVRPTSGRVSIEGRVAALLELGAGFNPEFTGRENVYLNSEIMGLPRRQAEKIFPQVEAFAEIGDFIDRPVKEYSSGMYVRLAFATAIHVEPDILIVDEALAVGDAIFANRCLQKLEELKDRKVTILFVSHDLGLVKRLCHRAILMYRGEALLQGRPADVVNRYVGLVHERGLGADRPPALSGNYRHGDGTSRIDAIEILNEDGQITQSVRSGERVSVRVHASFLRRSPHPIVGVLIRNRLGIEIYGTNTRLEQIDVGEVEAGESIEVTFSFPCLLTRQDYTLTVATQNADGSSQDWRDDALQFTVVDDKDTAGFANFKTEVTWSAGRTSDISGRTECR